MKKLHFAIILLITIGIQSAFAQDQETPPVRLEKISGNLYEVLDGRGSKGGAYIGDNGILVIDAKMDIASVDQTIAELKKITDKPILYLVNTHSDGDHINGNRFFPESTTIIAQKNCLLYKSGSTEVWLEIIGHPGMRFFLREHKRQYHLLCDLYQNTIAPLFSLQDRFPYFLRRSVRE